MSGYDQRWVRRAEQGFRSGSSTVKLCDVCGDNKTCAIRTALKEIKHCWPFKPVIGFTDNTGLNALSFNTFRRGRGWYHRVMPGDRVRLMTGAVMTDATVCEKDWGDLGSMLSRHAALNHLMLGLENPAARLLDVLRKLYGRNYAALTETYTVIYMEPVDGSG